MSASPSKELEVEVGAQSPDEQEHMDRDQPEPSQQPPVFDFEVKEQDRWLPIANGESSSSRICILCPALPCPALFYFMLVGGRLPSPPRPRTPSAPLPFVGFLPSLPKVLPRALRYNWAVPGRRQGADQIKCLPVRDLIPQYYRLP